jgi:LuxR family maltose regulon positive regulatory protein
VTSSKVYQDRQQLIKMIQTDYAYVRKELLNLSSSLREKEIRLSKLADASFVDLGQTSENNVSTLDRCSRPIDSRTTHGLRSVLPPIAQAAYVPSLEVHCLGKFRVLVDSKEIVHWGSLKAKSLLKYLAGNREHLASRDILMETLWSECEPSTANNNLKVAVLALRKTLEFNHGGNGTSQVVLFKDGDYIINPRVALYVDAEQFEYHCHAGMRLEREEKEDEAIAEYDTAITLYGGDFLEDSMYEDWTLIKRETLKDKYLAISSKLADYLIKKADYEGAVICCQKVLSKDRCREDIYRRLMCCYSRMGQRNRAIKWYRMCEETIRRELDVSPDHELVALYQKLSKGEYI